MVTGSPMSLFSFKPAQLNKIEIQFFSCTSPILSAQQPHVVIDCLTEFPSSQSSIGEHFSRLLMLVTFTLESFSHLKSGLRWKQWLRHSQPSEDPKYGPCQREPNPRARMLRRLLGGKIRAPLHEFGLCPS